MDSDLDKKHELRKSLMSLKMINMKLKKNLRFAMKTRYTNRSKLENSITQLNSILSTLKFNTSNEIVENVDRKTAEEFRNPMSIKLESDNENKLNIVKSVQINSTSATNSLAVYKYFCDRCEYKSKNKTSFDIHMRRHEGIKPYMCGICQKTFVARYELKLHLPKHSSKRNFSCKECDYTTYRPDMLMNHYDKHSTITVYSCEKCDFRTDKKSKLISHYKIHNPESDDQSKTCNAKSCAACEIAKDFIKCLETSNPKSNLENFNVDKTEHICDKPYICTACGWAYKKKGSLEKHMKRHTGERPFACDVCNYTSASKNTLKIHQRTHTGYKPYVCDHCPFRCTTKGYLNIHLNKHLGIKPFACDKCDYRSIDSSKLTVHQKVRHSGEKPFACEICSFRAKLPSRLRQHMITHGSRPFVCPHCAKSFSIKRTLQEHEGIHTGNQPYQCKLCKVERRFTLKVSYKQHLAMHQLKFSCNLCTYKTALNRDLKRHMKVHLKSSYRPRKRSEKTLQCELCKFKCVQSLSLIKHMNVKHSKNSKPSNLLNNIENSNISQTNKSVTNISVPISTPQTPLILNIPNAQSFQMEQNQPPSNYSLNSIKDYAPTFSLKYGIPPLSSMYSHQPEQPLMNMLHLCDLCNYSSTDPTDVTIHKKTMHTKPSNFIFHNDYYRGPLV